MPSWWTRRGFGHGQQQQVELLERLRQPRQEAARLPARLRRHPGLAVHPVVVVLEEEAVEPLVQLGQGQDRRRPAAMPGGA